MSKFYIWKIEFKVITVLEFLAMGLFGMIWYSYKVVVMLIHHIPIAYWVFKYKFLLRRRHKTKVANEEEESVENEVVVITGANRGMGKQLALEFAKRGAIVVMGCRDIIKGHEALEDISVTTGNHKLNVFRLDLSNMDSVENFASKVIKKFKKIKILINNAGDIGKDMERNIRLLEEEECNSVLTTNHLGPFLLTNLLLGSLKDGSPSRIVMISSVALLFSELSLNNLSFRKYGYSVQNNLPYSNSKHCNTLFAMELAKRTKHLGITTSSLCPGMVDTDIFMDYIGMFRHVIKFSKNIIATSPEEAVKQFVLPMALWKSLSKESGKMYLMGRPFCRANKKISKEKQLSLKVWNLSAYLVQLEERRKRLNLHKSVCI